MEIFPKFTIDESGVYFTVLVFEDYVVKIPKKDKVKQVSELKFISDSQTKLSDIKGVLPCWLIENVLVMPKAKGKRSDQYPEKKAHIKALRNEILEKIKGKGYELRDTGQRNMFYDEEQDQVYMIDFHAIKLLDNKKEKQRINDLQRNHSQHRPYPKRN